MKVANQVLIDKARMGDLGAKAELLEALEPLIISSIRKYYYRPGEFEDLVQEGRVKVLESLADFDPARGVHFLGYVQSVLKFFYLNKNGARQVLSLDYESESGEALVNFLEAEANIEEDYMAREGVMALRKAMSGLTDRERESLRLFYIEEISLGDIASSLGISYRTVVNNKARALKKLKEILDSKI